VFRAASISKTFSFRTAPPPSNTYIGNWRGNFTGD
jgi:hypothetical protein